MGATRSHRRARWAVAALMAAALLAGCSSTVAGDALPADPGPAKPTVPAAGPGGADPAALPIVGTCYDLDAGQESTPLDPPGSVSCGDPHDAETAVVGDTGLGPDDERPVEDDLYDDTPLGRAFGELCSLDDVVAYLGGEDPEDPYAYYASFLPSEDQWEAGARWMRCDVFYGYTDPETAPGVMAGGLAGPDSAAYRVCFSGSATSYGVVPCSEPHEAEPTGFALADVPEGAPYPDEPTRQALAASCADEVQEYVGGPAPFGYAAAVWVDEAEDWPDGGDARCVLVPAGGGSTTGSVRP
ncbi:septum formation family protein [Trujillonella endophytica]|uniref:Septum formation n=1 Tax=Trujillonella endophytica TaxID=673521 RepID=A0A1H8T2V3_9ACTN|nr:septum formation family protein [Trujillella endophytica]SEO85320.1 Septum formation [Trujillella endophytica]